MLGTNNLVNQGDVVPLTISTVTAQALRVQITGTWTGTINIQGSVDGVNYVNMKFKIESDLADAFTSAITVNQIYLVNPVGMQAIRVIWTTKSSGGPVTVTEGLVFTAQ